MLLEEYEIDALQSPQSEFGLLHILLTKPSAWDTLNEFNPDWFYTSANKSIANAVKTLAGNGKDFDPISVFDHLQTAGTLSDVGGMPYINSIVCSVASANPNTLAEILKEKYIKRVVNQLINDANVDIKNQDPETFIDLIQSKLDSVTVAQHGASKLYSTVDCLHELVDDLEQKKFKNNPNLIPSGVACIDNFFNGGFNRGEMIVIGARASMGKTAMACTIGLSMSRQNHVLMFSMEMTRLELTRRNLSNLANVPMSWLNTKHGGENDDYWKALTVGNEAYMSRNFWIDERSNLSIGQIVTTVKKAKRKSKVDVVIIDYLTLMNIGNGKSQNRAQDIGDITKRIKDMAKDLGVVVLLLAQVNRESTKGENKRPTMAHLRDSGSIEQDADVVLLIHRPEYYHKEDADNHTGHTEVIVDKYRNGATGIINMTFEGEYSRFVEFDGRVYNPNNTNGRESKFQHKHKEYWQA